MKAVAASDVVGLALVLAHAACCGGAGTATSAPPAAMIVVSKGGGTLADHDASSQVFDKIGTLASDGKVALVEVLTGFARVPLDGEAQLSVVPGSVLSTAMTVLQADGRVRVSDASGARTIEVPGAAGGILVAPAADAGLVRVTDDTGGVAFQRYAGDGRLVHEAKAPKPSAAATSVAMVSAGDVAAVAFEDGDHTQLMGFAIADGAVRWQYTVAGRYAAGFAGVDGASFAVIVEDRAACETCTRIEVHRFSDGALLRGTRLGYTWSRGASFGVAGDLVWVFRYQPRGSDHMLGGHHEASCSYDVFSTAHNTGKPVRTLADATGDWRQLNQGCAVHGLAPAPDGRVVALYVPRFDRAEAMLLAGPP